MTIALEKSVFQPGASVTGNVNITVRKQLDVVKGKQAYAVLLYSHRHDRWNF